MEPRRLIEEMVPRLTRNAAVVAIEEQHQIYVVTIAGTTNVTASCEVPRATADTALHSEAARAELGRRLKETADRTVAEVPDGRG